MIGPWILLPLIGGIVLALDGIIWWDKNEELKDIKAANAREKEALEEYWRTNR